MVSRYSNPRQFFCDHEISAFCSMTSLGLLRCETWADPSVMRKKNVRGNSSRLGRSRTEAEICGACISENGTARVLRNVGVPLPDTTLPVPKEFNFYGRCFESFHFSVNTVRGWLPESTHVCPSSSQFVTAVYFYRLSREVSFTRTPQTSADNKGMSVCHVYLRRNLAVR